MNNICHHDELWYACKKCYTELLVWEAYDKVKEELADERSKRKQIEELYDNLKADVAPLIKSAKELNVAGNDDTRTIQTIRKAVKYL